MHRLFKSFLSLAAVGAFSWSAIAAEPSSTARVIATSSRPHVAVVADVNGDGLPDLVVADLAGEVQVLAMRADGGYQTTGMYQLSSPAAALTASDFDGDGYPDILMATQAGPIFLLKGNGDGTFQTPLALSAGLPSNTQVTAVAAGDFNEDGRADLAIGGSHGDLYTLLGKGDGTFDRPQAVQAGRSGGSIAVGDVDGDGHVDLVFAVPGGVSYLSGKGNGSFGPVTSVWSGNEVAGVAITSLGASSGNSVVLSDQSGKLWVLNRTSNAFSTTQQFTTSAGVVTAGDFDGDGHADIAVASPLGNSIQFFSGRGDGTLRAPKAIDTGMPVSVLAAPSALAGASVLSFASETAGAVGVITMIRTGTSSGPVSASRTLQTAAVLSKGAGTLKGVSPASQQATIISLSSSPTVTTYGKSVTLTAVVSPGNATGLVAYYDGVTFLGSATLSNGSAAYSTTLLAPGTRYLTAHYIGDPNNLPSSSSISSHTVTDALGTGFPTYTAVSVPGSAQPGWVVVSDFNRDGRQDAALVNSGNNTVSVFLGNGNGTFGYPTTLTTYQVPYAGVAADFNGDGFQDLAVSALDGVEIFRGNGTGTFSSPTTFAAGANPSQVVVGDFNNDGIPDLAVANGASSTVSVLFGNGDGTFATAVNLPTGNTSGSGTTALVVLDYNRDGNADLAAIDTTDGLVYLFAGNGNGTFQGVASLNVGGTPADIASADFNWDGAPDLVIVDSTNSQILVLLGNGNGTFQPAVTYPTGSLPVSVAISDFNGDGQADLAVANGFDTTISVFLGTGTGAFQPGSTYPGVTYNPGGFLVQLTTGEFNGDGATDLAVANAGDILGTSGMPGNLGIMLAGACSFSTSPTSIAYDSRGGATAVTIFSTSPSCAWAGASSDTSWITLSSSSEVGTAAVTVTIAPNTTGTTRTGSVTLGGQVIAVTEGGTVQVFTDVPPTAYYFDAVDLLAQKGITNGCTSTTFCPTANITRAQMAVFIVRAVYNGTDNFTYSPTPYFSDVTPTTFGFQWIQKLYELGITTGCGPGIFCPTSNVTRDQMAVFIIRARYGSATTFDYNGVPYFTDVPSNAFAFQYIQRMKMDAITSGCTATTYCPSNPVTRGDMAIFIMRGGFNDLLPAGTPVITAISPTTLARGTTAAFLVTGAYTNFVQGLTSINTSSGWFSVNSITVTGPTTMTVQISASSAAPAQPVSIFVSTGSQEAVLPNGLMLQ